MIDNILQFLTNNFENEGYYVKEFSEGLFFGRDKEDNIICAKSNKTKESPFSLSTKAIDLYQNYHFIFQTTEGTTDGNYDMIILKNSFVDTKKTFINLCLNFYNSTDERSIRELTNDLIEMYKINIYKSEEEEQGLWAELFSILYLNNKTGKNISEFWHNDNFNKYDFSLSETKKIEVKSTKKEVREHKFSHEQIYTDYDVIISSVMVRKDDNGYTIYDLYSQVEELFASKYELLIKIEKLLMKFDKKHLNRYDYNYSMNNIKFYLNKKVPHFDVEEPNGVHGTEYVIVLENEQELSLIDVDNFI